MKRSLLTGLGLTLLTSAQLMGCADSGDSEECLPGDKDCADASGGVALWLEPGTVAHFRNQSVKPR